MSEPLFIRLGEDAVLSLQLTTLAWPPVRCWRNDTVYFGLLRWRLVLGMLTVECHHAATPWRCRSR